MNAVRKNLLSGVVQGYDDLEPCIMAAAALKSNIMLTGAHGIGKTSLFKTLARALDETGKGFRFYAADKVLLTDIGGLPDMEKSRETGKWEWIKTQRSIWDANVVVIDELPRADKQRQNYLMEPLEEGTFQGDRHNAEMFVATGNDITYDGNFDMDAALRSRFLFWLVAPDFKRMESQEVEKIVDINWDRALSDRGVLAEQEAELARSIGEKLAEMRDVIHTLRNNEGFRRQVTKFIGVFTQLVKSKIADDPELTENTEAYISPREFGTQLAQAIIGLTAYFRVMGYSEPVRAAGKEAIKYNIETRHAGAGDKFVSIVNMAWTQLNGMLINVEDMSTPKGKIQVDFACCLNPAQKVDFWRNNIDEIVNVLDPGDVKTMSELTLQQIDREDKSQIGPLWHTMRQNTKTEWIAAEVEGFMITEIARKLLAGGANPNAPERTLWNKFSSEQKLSTEAVSEILTFSS